MQQDPDQTEKGKDVGLRGKNRNLPESSSPSNSKNAEKKLLMESPRRRRVEGTARVPLLGTLPEEEREVHHRDHKNRTGCSMDRVAFMEEIWTVVQSYGTQSVLKIGLNRQTTNAGSP